MAEPTNSSQRPAATKIKTPESTPSKETDKPVLTPANKTTVSHLAKLTPKQGIVIKEKQATDFFGRIIKVSAFLFSACSRFECLL